VLFEQRFWAGIAEGRVTLTFRRWRRPQVVAGRPYRTSGGTRVQVTAIGVVAPTEITDADAARTGHGSAAEVLADLRGRPADPIYRVEFHRLEEPDPRAELAAAATLTDADVHDITRRLERLDRASGHGPWTSATLHAIAAQPGRRAPDLAAWFGRETLAFKTDVRKLKNLGLTYSRTVGYELSPRGQAYLRHTSGATTVG
jgi:hypothetical protein